MTGRWDIADESTCHLFWTGVETVLGYGVSFGSSYPTNGLDMTSLSPALAPCWSQVEALLRYAACMLSYEGCIGVMLKQGLVHFELMLRPSGAIVAFVSLYPTAAVDTTSL